MKSKSSLEDCLTVTFSEPFQLADVRILFTRIAKQLHCRIAYTIEQHEHVGTGDPSVNPNKFRIKKDRKDVKGHIIAGYIFPFIVPMYQGGLYYRLDFQAPEPSDPPMPEYLEDYYALIRRIRTIAQEK